MRTLVCIASRILIVASVVMAWNSAFAQAGNCDDPRINTEACQRERAAAAQAKSQGQLTTKGDEQYQKNALARCQNQPEGAARDACVKRATGEGDTTVRGSVEGGGKMRSNTMEVPAPKK